MSNKDQKNPPSRRAFLSGAALGVGLASVAGADLLKAQTAPEGEKNDVEPFLGQHQSGITTPAQSHAYYAAFDLVTTKREELIELLKLWTQAAQLMTEGRPVEIANKGEYGVGNDSGDMIGLSPAHLTITFGFGATLFTKDGQDRYGLASKRPEAFTDLPIFPGEQLQPARTGGDLMVQACANNPQVVLHAIRQLARLAEGIATYKWVQAGFVSDYGAKKTPRNLMGFKDGTNNPIIPEQLWVGNEGSWMQNGSYIVVRRSRIALEHWDRMKESFQGQTFGRHKQSGAPLGKSDEFDAPDFNARDEKEELVIPEHSHMRLAHPSNNEGASILRRSYSYDDGVTWTAERWPPWRQGMMLDAGLIFVCFQRDPRTQFTKMFEKMSRFDMMNQFVTNTGGGLFACPGGIAPGEYIGQKLFEM